MFKPIMYTTRVGNKIWKNSLDQFHRIDGPAVEYSNGSKEWWQNGERHRLDGPAIENPVGAKSWFQNGQLHRLDGPAIEYDDGTKYWYQNGDCHRKDGPAIEYKSGSNRWYYKNDFLGVNLEGFWKLWDRLNDEERQNVNLHMWLARLQNV